MSKETASIGLATDVVGITVRFCFLLLLGTGGTAFAGRPAEGKQSLKAEKSATERKEKIRAEIKALPDHPWAGEYYAGDGLGVGTTLAVAPDAGYVFEWHGCLGLYDRNYGVANWEAGRLRLSFTFENKQKGFQGIAPELVPVAWGPRHYLVPTAEMIEFCNAINDGSEPRAQKNGIFFLREGDEAKEAVGSPALPEEIRGYLLPAPVTANVTAVGAYATRPSIIEAKFKLTPVTIDAGSNQGLRVGMKLVATSPDTAVETVQLTRVEATRSEGTVSQFGEELPGPQVGWTLSTRAPWNEGKR